MLVILPGVMDVSWCRPPGLGYSKVNTAILRKYVFELSQIRFSFENLDFLKKDKNGAILGQWKNVIMYMKLDPYVTR